MTYEQALTYIHSRNRFGIKLGLERMRALLELLGAPHAKYPVIHIAGTNGKGSTTALVSTVLKVAGYRVGVFTSPHLSSYCERMSINGTPIAPERLAVLVEKIRLVVEEAALDPMIGPPTEFEFGTLLALAYFAAEQVDLAVFEVGMGGRLDATNVLMPLVSGITHIALDHQEYLGNDLISIAKEKAGIIKPKIPVVIAPQTAEVSALLEETAQRQHAPPYLVGREVHYTLERTDQTGTYLKLQWKDDFPFKLRVNLFGAHQAANAALAYGLLQTVKSQGFSWRREDLEEGFNTVVWPGRMEYFPGPPRVLLDGAHNPDGVLALAHGLSQLFPKQEFCVILGVLDNRPVEVMATQLSSLLAGRLQRVYATTVPEAKAASCERISRSFQARPVDVVLAPDPARALSLALAELDNDEILVVAGSLYLVGYMRPLVLDYLAKKPGGEARWKLTGLQS